MSNVSATVALERREAIKRATAQVIREQTQADASQALDIIGNELGITCDIAYLGIATRGEGAPIPLIWNVVRGYKPHMGVAEAESLRKASRSWVVPPGCALDEHMSVTVAVATYRETTYAARREDYAQAERAFSLLMTQKLGIAPPHAVLAAGADLPWLNRAMSKLSY